MKKLVLLFTILCANGLIGMEQHPYYALPKELQQEIVNKALETSNSVDQVINSIKKFGVVYKVPYTTQAAVNLLMKSLPNDLKQAVEATKNLQGAKVQDFTKLVHLLVDKFNMTPYEIAVLFNTPIAEEYLKLANQLEELAYQYNDNPEELKNPIAQGADVNFYGGIHKQTPLNNAIWAGRLNKVGILLAAGANPLIKDSESNTALDQVLKGIEQEKRLQSQGYPGVTEKELRKLEDIKRLLEEAIEKQSTAAK